MDSTTTTLKSSITSLPTEVLFIVFDFMNNLTLVAFHNTNKDLHSSLPNKVPKKCLHTLHDIVCQANAFLVAYDILHDTHSDFTLTSQPTCNRRLLNRRHAEVLLEDVRYIIHFLLSEYLAPPNIYSRSWSTHDVIMFLGTKPVIRNTRWYHSKGYTDYMPTYCRNLHPGKRQVAGVVFVSSARVLHSDTQVGGGILSSTPRVLHRGNRRVGGSVFDNR